MRANHVSFYLIYSAVFCLALSNTTLAQADDVYESFEAYQFEKIVSDTENRLREQSENQKFITDLKLLDTLLSLNNKSQIILLQKFGFFNDLHTNDDDKFNLIFNDDERYVYESLAKVGRLKHITQFQNEGKINIGFSSVSQMQISALPDILHIPRNNDYDKAVANLYFNAIKDRIPQSADLVAKGFTINKYTIMEQRSLINTYQKMIKFRAAFLNFMFTKYNSNDR